MDVRTQSFLILGVSKSGYSAGKYLLERGGKCILYEEQTSPKITEAIRELTLLGAMLSPLPIEEETLKNIDVVIISPGVPINHEVAVKAKAMGKRIIGELEFSFLCFTPTTIAVTGTNGKTTTVSLIDAILKKAGKKSMLLGNVGVPVSSKIAEIEDDCVCVTEVSSFQLESVNAFCPHISCVLNISPDHLERHFDMQTYSFLKRRILKNQKESEYSVLNYDDMEVRSFFTESKAKTIWVSIKEKVVGAYALDGIIYFNEEKVTQINKVNLQGEHNLYNALFAVAVCKLLKVSNQDIEVALSEFKGVAHRIEFIEEINGTKYFNDSKSTNTASTINAIKSMKSPIVLILGGSEKGEVYDKLFEEISSSTVKHVVLTGASRFNMWKSAVKAGYENVSIVTDFFLAVKMAIMIAKEGDCVLLSPACASFDTFKNYEERGETFKKIVGEIK